MQGSVPTAIICSSDDEALMLIRQAKRAGINVPDDLSVISFDNSDLARFSHPRLTSMDHPSDYMGELAATALLSRVYHAETPVRTRSVIDSSVVNRDSVLDLPPA
jgi:DNA-binding LacI/PurR family transcriptional regulator